MKKILRSEWADLIFIASLLLGTFVRFNPTLLAGFPINDGGMFAVMMDDLRASHYRLPEFTTFNYLNIPYAYPPLGFYLGRIVADLFGWSSPEALRWVPPLFASLSIPAFYLLALQLLKNKYCAALSTLFFALMPRAFSTFVWGGGITRSPGQFFMLIALAAIINLYEKNRRVDIFWVGLFSGLAVMSHLEAALHTFVSAIFFWIMLSRSRTGLINSVAVGLIVLVVSAVWWGPVIHYHGINPLLHAAQAGRNVLSVFHLVFFAFTGEIFATLMAVLGLIGIAQRLTRRDYLLPLWMAIPFFVEGRNAATPAIIPLAMLASIGLVDVIFAALLPKVEKATPPTNLFSSIERNIILYLLLYLIFSASQFGWQLSSATLYSPDQIAMKWVQENTSTDSRFLVLTGTSSVSCDSVLEWFPTLAVRHSIFTVQGREWINGAGFNDFVRSTYAVQECLPNGDVSCLDAAVGRIRYDYIYVSKVLRTNACGSTDFPRTFPYFLESLEADPGFDPVYETEDVVIYENAAPN